MQKQSRVFNEKFEQLRYTYNLELHAKLDLIIAEWNQLQQCWERPVAELLYRHVHNLAGSGATFGFTKLSDTARELMALLDAALSVDQPFDSVVSHQACNLLLQLRAAASSQEQFAR